MKYLYLCLFIFLLSNTAKSDGYPAASIPENLKKNAYAVVRLSSESFTQMDVNSGTHKVTFVITILNEKGKDYADFYTFEDSFVELKNFSGEIINASGKTIKKLSKKDLTTTAISNNLASDDKRSFYEYHSPAYPFTVKYEYETKYKNGILIYPTFSPVNGFYFSVEKSNYTIQLPQDIGLRYKMLALLAEPEKSSFKNDSIFKWSVNNFEALQYERYTPANELFPTVLLSPSKFCVQNECGDMSTWENFGKWQKNLLQGRDQLPPATIEKVKELTSGVSDKREKVKRIYEFMQSSTHYVSIQLGIGGWRPMPASEVAKTGFGDCKALSNYTKALLSAIDIPSYYVVISTKNKRFFPDYPSFSQANHVVLMVPMENDSIWLECTSQTLPFDYIHSNIEGHDAMAVGNEKAFFCTLPSYSLEDALESNRVNLKIDENGNAAMQVHSTYRTSDYENKLYRLSNANNEEINKLLASSLNVHKPLVKNFKKEETRGKHPSMDLFYDVTCEDFAPKTGSRIFIPVNPAKTELKGVFNSSNRKFDIEFNSNLFQSDTIKIEIPSGYELESKPKIADITSEYGSFQSYFTQEGNNLTYIQTLKIKSGRYKFSQYEDLKNFYNRIESFQTGKVGLKKQ